MAKQAPQATVDLKRCAHIAEACMNSRLRKLSRTVGAIYDDAFRATGLRGTQFNLLVALALRRRATVKQLAALLVVDRTTLTRSLAPLERDGLVLSQPGQDGRERVLELTPVGSDRLATAMARWERAQARLMEILGPEHATRLTDSLNAVAALLEAR